ncbi:MAG: ferredoxin [Spirochaetia bacterium]|jgi:aerobic-type carbon monoxide dehydrogenase small subunit (CoxS/CutS family)|nr:ferredoxin [Spirochaetia bacterium]
MIKLAMTLNKTPLELIVSETKPLSDILYEDMGISLNKVRCDGNCCGGCLVLVDGKPVLGCMTPAFLLQGKTVTTFDYFMQTAHYRNIRRTYDALGSEPCPDCYQPKTLIIESILLRFATKKANRLDTLDANSRNFMEKRLDKNTHEEIDENMVAREFSLSTCKCMNSSELLEIVKAAREDRIKRNVL